MNAEGRLEEVKAIQDAALDCARRARRLLGGVKDPVKRKHIEEFVVMALEGAAMACDDLVDALSEVR